MPYKQEDRLIAVDTPLGKDVLLLTSFGGHEGISRLFEFELTMLSENHSVSFEAIIGEKATISVVLADGSKRYFNGIISSFSQGRGGGETEKASDPRLTNYTATLVPRLWLLTRTSDLRVLSPVPPPAAPPCKGEFSVGQFLDAREIIKQILCENEIAFRDATQGSYEKREFCLQYRETDFNIISRLMEEEGIYYFFEHEDGKHTMVLADDPGEHKPCPNQASAKYQITAGKGVPFKEDVIVGIEKRKEIRAGKYTQNDYNFEIPNANLKVEMPSKQKLGPGEREVYDFPGGYTKRTVGEQLTNRHMEEEEAQIETIKGTSVCRAFTSGYRFTLEEHYRGDLNKDYVLVHLYHEARHGASYPGEPLSTEEFSYSNYFECIPFDVTYRPPRITPKPSVQGTQTAIVVGTEGEAYYIDDKPYGMVKVQFHWDREHKKNEKGSCWVRVAYPYAGEKHGMQFSPLIGDEVIVDFLDGDPDRPIVTGSLFKGMDKAIVAPDQMIRNRILTPYQHQLVFDDKGASITLNTGGGETITMADGKKDKSDYGNNIKISTADGHFIHLFEGLKGRGITISTLMQHRFVMDDGVAGISIKIEDQSKKMSITLNSTSEEMTVENKGSGKLVLKAQGEIWIQSNTKILMEAPDIQILGSGYIKVESKGANDVKGNPVKLNC